MKKFRIVVAIIVMVILQTGCATISNTSREDMPKDIRGKFIGTWKGKHVDHEKNLSRSWIQHRSEDGTYTIIFVELSRNGTIKSKEEKGKWWIEGDTFYEVSLEGMEKPDAYQFEILSEREIRFKSVVNNYEFIDKRM